MPLNAGEKLGPYEIVAPLGEGGMGVVYRARDTRLGREVAVKMLPAEFERDASRRRRFEEEARALAALNHPNILAVYDVGENYLVTELVEGDSLAGAKFTLRKSLDVAAQIAEGLAAAHATGITHRDLKPDNVMVTKDGRVKILDFGLAKQDDSTISADDRTVKAPTTPGTVMGTVGYMSPEQVRGLTAGPTSDIFSLGVILHELIGGERTFRGASGAETMSAIVNSDAPSLPPGTPSGVIRLIDRCLAKAPGERWQSARDLAAQLRWLSESGSGATTIGASEPVKVRRGWQPVVIGALSLALAGVSVVAVMHLRETAPAEPLQRFEITKPDKVSNVNGLSVSPDGQWIVFRGTSDTGVSMLYRRRVDNVTVTPIAGTEGIGSFALWSPDSRSLAFRVNDQFKTVPVSGGPPQTLFKGTYSLGSWGADDTILASDFQSLSFVAIPAGGGSPRTVMKFSEIGAANPRWLPDGKHFLYTMKLGNRDDKSGIYLGSADGKVQKALLPVSGNLIQYVPGSKDPLAGRILYRSNDGVLTTHTLDVKRQVVGEASPLIENVRDFSVSGNGLLVYRAGGTLSRLDWLDRTGKHLESIGEPALWDSPRLSPDGKRIAVRKTDQGNDDIWMVDIARNLTSRFTFDKGADGYPLWSPDGASVVFTATRDGGQRLHQKLVASAQPETEILKGETVLFASSFAPDGKTVLYERVSGATMNTMTLALSTGANPSPTHKTESFNDFHSVLTRDGKWVAYVSNESGAQEVYVQPFPTSGAKWQISTKGGFQPEWRADGKELYYAQGNRLMAVDIRAGAVLEAGAPKQLFELRGLRTNSRLSYQPAADGSRFLAVVAADDQQDTPLQVVLNWEGLLKKK